MATYFSAASLVKSSAAQIIFYRNNPRTITQGITVGTEYQHKVSQLLGDNVVEEMRTSLQIGDDIIINACHDIVASNYILEVKMVTPYEGAVDKWYLDSCILQCALFKALLMESDGHICTPKFMVDQGIKEISMDIDTQLRYLLMFGKALIEIEVPDSKALLRYFVNKAKATLDNDYIKAKAWDSQHKHKEFNDTYYNGLFGFNVLQDAEYNIVERPWNPLAFDNTVMPEVEIPEVLLAI